MAPSSTEGRDKDVMKSIEISQTRQRGEENGCRLSKYHSQKPESTRRTIFNQDSTLQLIVQISSGNVNSSVRALAKTHRCTPVSIELPRGRHLGLDACISMAQTPASFGLECPHLHCIR